MSVTAYVCSVGAGGAVARRSVDVPVEEVACIHRGQLENLWL